MTSTAPRSIDDVKVGATAVTPIRVSEDDMEAFARLSGDRSSIHVDADYAKAAGFAGRVVYGGLLVAALSRMVGMILPGPIGVAAGWKVNFHAPLYVDEAAVLQAEVTQVSEAAKFVALKFEIRAGERLIAKGSAEAKIVVQSD